MRGKRGPWALARRLARVARLRSRRRGRDRVLAEPGFERWSGNGALGYLVLDEIVRATARPPPAEHARVIVVERCFPTGVLGHWVRRLAEGGLVAALTATSPRRLPHPEGGPPLTGTNPLAIAIPSSDGRPLVATSRWARSRTATCCPALPRPRSSCPFGGEQAHKAFALAVGLELLVGALAGPEPGAVLVVARPEHDPVPALRALAAGRRLPGG